MSTSYFPHPPLVVSNDLCVGDGFVGLTDWDASASASTATSVSSSSGSNSSFLLQYGQGMHSSSLLDDVVRREHDVRQELAGLRNKLAT
ncbi:hypothetical protein SPBR_08767 [Sporothrix brasiliensis 5110]|uniref:Uncharacterized protein n=1 Tax=Sporothrix brasiliensis 5110 TaxID=1398154 RepID=A0A0C2IHB0_9PEZI|nr:uncharacterized protein SPBR_08767 [Sporothrix brasiliensis 5110]KIH86415.1 hypothetical protein SPBR_08767 [Sporothrix brasiliensis 5110]